MRARFPPHTDASRRPDPAEHGGRLPVKDSVGTREGLIFIRMTDLCVRVTQLRATRQLTSTCVTKLFGFHGAAERSGIQESAARAPLVHYITAPKILNSVTAQGDHFYLFF